MDTYFPLTTVVDILESSVFGIETWLIGASLLTMSILVALHIVDFRIWLVILFGFCVFVLASVAWSTVSSGDINFPVLAGVLLLLMSFLLSLCWLLIEGHPDPRRTLYSNQVERRREMDRRAECADCKAVLFLPPFGQYGKVSCDCGRLVLEIERGSDPAVPEIVLTLDGFHKVWRLRDSRGSDARKRMEREKQRKSDWNAAMDDFAKAEYLRRQREK